MTTNPPRSLSPFDSRGRRVLRLPNGTGTYLCVGSKPWDGDGDPLEYIGWVWRERHDPTQADLTDLTDAEIREICHAPADEREGVIARIAASRKAADPQALRTFTLSVPDSEEDRILTYPDGSWRWLLSADEGEDRSETSPVWPADRKPDLEVSLHLTEAEALSLLPRDGREDRIAQIHDRPAESAGAREEGLCSLSVESDVSEASTLNPESVRRPNIPIEIHLTRDEATALLPRDGREDRIAQIRASRTLDPLREETGKILESWAPTCSPEFAESMRAQGLGAREPTWEEPEDLVAEPPHYRLPGGREALEDVIAPICDALSERRLPGSAVYMVGNALKYLARLGAKGSPLEDLRKAREYLDRAIARMTAE